MSDADGSCEVTIVNKIVSALMELFSDADIG